VQRNALVGAVSVFLTLAAAMPAGAATFGEVLKKVDGNPRHNPPCLEVVTDPAVPSERPFGRCATNTVGGLYLGLLRDRERLDIVRSAIARQQDLLKEVQQYVESGSLYSGESLLAEIELKRWQVQEAEITRGILHAELFFTSMMDTEPSELVMPRVDPSSWPRDQAFAQAALAQHETIPESEMPAVQNVLQHAWIDYQAARRALELLRPMSAFAQDLDSASQAQFAVGRLSLAIWQQRMRNAVELQEAVVNAEYQLLAIQFTILELMGRRSAID